MIAIKVLSDRELLLRLLALGATYTANVICDKYKAVGVLSYQGASFPFHESHERILTLADSDSRKLACSILERRAGG